MGQPDTSPALQAAGRAVCAYVRWGLPYDGMSAYEGLCLTGLSLQSI